MTVSQSTFQPGPIAAWAALCHGLGVAAGCVPLGDLDQHSSQAGGAQDSTLDAGPGAPDAADPEPLDTTRPPGRPSARDADAAPGAEESPPAAPDAAGDDVAPRLTGSLPADGAQGVSHDTRITLAFSEPMDKPSVEAAFVSATLPDGPHVFTWDPAGTLLEIALSAPLAYAEGTDPEQLAALQYEYRVTSAARDLAGNALRETTVSFSTLRRVRVSASAVADAGLTGNWRSDGIYGTDGCAPAGTQMCVGDSSFGPNASYRGFASFALGQLVATGAEVSAATLEMTLVSTLGSPFAQLGALALEHVPFTSVGPEAFSAPALARMESVASAPASGVLSFNVLAALASDLGAGRALSQYRFRFQTFSDLDGSTDLLFLQRYGAVLSITYVVP